MWAGPGLWKIKKVENKTTADGQKKVGNSLFMDFKE